MNGVNFSPADIKIFIKKDNLPYGLSPRSVLAILHIWTIPDALRHFWTAHTSFVRSGLSGPGIIGSHTETNTQSVNRKEKHWGINMSRTLGQRSGALRHTSLAF